MLKEKMYFERKKAVLLTVDFSGTIEEYAMAWLKLTNNAREYGNMIWKIENCSGNNVYVYCNPKSADAVKDFCEGIYVSYHEDEEKMHYIGKVIEEEEVTVGVPIYEWESTCKVDDPQWEEDCDKSIGSWMAVDSE